MSAYLLGIGFKADMGTCPRKLLLLKMIDACEDDGTKIFPAVATMARAAQCSERTVQREVKLFLEVGLIRLVREGGRGKGNTNEYALNLDLLWQIAKEGWDKVAAAVTGEGQNAKGDTMSPKDETSKGDTGDGLRVTNGLSKGDIACHPTPPLDPSLDPSIERERADEPANAPAGADAGEASPGLSRDAWRRRFKKLHRQWPTFVTDSHEEAEAKWFALSETDREAAAKGLYPYLAKARASGRSKHCAFGVFLKEKRWERLEAADLAKSVGGSSEEARPFGKLWSAYRLDCLFGEPTGSAPPPPAFIQRVLDGGGPMAERERRSRLAKYGWPQVTRLHGDAKRRRGTLRAGECQALEEALSFEQVKRGGALWDAWGAEHAARGWPWLGDAEPPEWIWMPALGAGCADGDFVAYVRAVLEQFEQVKAHVAEHAGETRKAAE